MLNMTALAAQVCGIKPRFEQTHCSQCGNDTGPGDSGHSSCATHGPQAVEPDLKDMYSYEYVTSLGLSLRCYLEYEEAEKQTNSEPGCSESIDLVYAFAGLIDISEVLHDDVKALIEEKALSRLKAEDQDARTEAAISRHMSQMEAA